MIVRENLNCHSELYMEYGRFSLFLYTQYENI